MSLESDARAVSCRKALKVAVSALASEAGFERAEEAAVETLTEMLQSCKYTRYLFYICYIRIEVYKLTYEFTIPIQY